MAQACDPTGTRIVAVVSAANRHGAKRVTEALTRQLAVHAELTIRIVASSSEATEAARHAATTARIVVAAGGDGTVADVATGIFASGASLAIVPTGSTNITARTLGIPTSIEAAIATIARPHTVRTIDVGRSGARVFLHIAGAGFDAEMFKSADPAWKRRLGWVAYLPAAAAAMRLPASRVTLTADGERIETSSPLVLVANGGSAITPAFSIYPGIAVDDGWLDLLVLTATTPSEIVAALGHAMRRRLHRSTHIIWRQAKSVRLEADPPLAVQLDGDARGTTPRDFTIVAGGIDIVTPLR